MKRPFIIVISSLMASILLLPAYAAKDKYEVVEVTNGGTIKGQVTFRGKEPPPKTHLITQDTHICGEGTREVDYVKVNNGALNEVVVYLTNVKKGKPFTEDVINAQIEQKACAFLPFLAVVANGGELTIINSDPVSYNIHAYKILERSSAKPTLFDASQSPYLGSQVTQEINLKRRPSSNGLKVECERHDFMHGFVFVAKNPYYTIVAEDGTYTIEDIPPGRYKVNAWHGYLKDPRNKRITLEAGKTATIDFEYRNRKK